MKLNLHFNVYGLEVYFNYILSILQLCLRSILQEYFTPKKSYPLLRIHLSQWTTLWIEFNCLKAAESQGGLIFKRANVVFQPPYGFEPETFGLLNLHPKH